MAENAAAWKEWGEQFSVPCELGTIACCKCGITFAVPVRLEEYFRKSRERFYCPTGHGQSYTKSTEMILWERAEAAERERDWYQSQAQTAERGRIAQKAQTTKARNELRRVKQRTSAGVCPCCNRTFQDLARHMKGQHPGYGGQA